METENKFDIVRFILGVLISLIINGIGIQLGLTLMGLMNVRGDLALIFVVVPFILNWLTYLIAKKPSIRKGILFGFVFSIIISYYALAISQIPSF